MIYAKVNALSLILLASLGEPWAIADDDSPAVSFAILENEIDIQVDGRSMARYVFQDAEIPRPYFAQVKAPNGIQVTRPHPPRAGQDSTDHATMHPGIWMAFGDLDGADFWRNQASIKHAGFLQAPRGGAGSGSFVEQKDYLREDGSLVCQEAFRLELQVMGGGYLFLWKSTFHSEREFFFGDQEEMGLGIRVATPLSEQAGGSLTDAEGRQGARAIWSNAARWCDYSGVVDGQSVGMTIFVHPDNFRPSWMHARNYGFVAANPFGRQAMHQGAASKVVVRPGESLTLRYAVWIHSGSGGQVSKIEQVFSKYLKAM